MLGELRVCQVVMIFGGGSFFTRSVAVGGVSKVVHREMKEELRMVGEGLPWWNSSVVFTLLFSFWALFSFSFFFFLFLLL